MNEEIQDQLLEKFFAYYKQDQESALAFVAGLLIVTFEDSTSKEGGKPENRIEIRPFDEATGRRITIHKKGE